MSSRLARGLFIVTGLCAATTLGSPQVAAPSPDFNGRSVIARLFERHGASTSRATQVAQVVWEEAERQEMDPLLVAAIITVENPTLRQRATSTRGASGLMQVMPAWHRMFRQSCGKNALDDRTNICMGIRVFQTHLADARGSLPRTLRAYSGCKVTPGCGRYSQIVLTRHRGLQVALAATREVP